VYHGGLSTGRGNEYIAVHHKSGTAFVSWVFLREVFSDRTKQADNAGIYLVDLNAKDLVLLKAELVNFNAVLHPHGIAVLEENEKVYLFVVNHREAEYVEIFEFKDKKLYHVSSVTSPDFVSLNDVYPISSTSFYATNDHGLRINRNLRMFLEDIPGLCLGSVVFVKDGTSFFAAKHLCSPNGVHAGSKNRLYVTETIGKSLVMFHIEPNNSLTLNQRLPIDSALDNINLITENGKDILYVAGHVKLLAIMKYMSNPQNAAPSQVFKITVSDEDVIVEEIYLMDGNEVPACTGAMVHEDKILLGTLAAPYILYCKL